jgi:hypothetical protein
MTPTREEALAHFGVKGMRWGVRKAIAPGGGIDRVIFGKRAAQNIAKQTAPKKTPRSRDGGRSATNARLHHLGIAAVRGILALYAASLVTRTARGVITVGVHNKVVSDLAKSGRDAIPAIMATAAKLKYAPLKGGAFVITTLK